jgi:hypothetical protein
MHCPRCGQQQVSEDTRFCSRCGFPLALVSEILLNGGTLPQLVEAQNSANQTRFTRNNGLKFSLAWFLVVTFLLTPIAALADADELAALFAIFGFIGGILMMILSLLFLENPSKKFPGLGAPGNIYQTNNYLSGAPTAQPNALPPPLQQTYPVAAQDFAPPVVGGGGWKAPNTGELARPHSVTEGTTKLLNKDE